MDTAAIPPTPPWSRVAAGSERRGQSGRAFAEAFADTGHGDADSAAEADDRARAPRRDPPTTGEIGPHHVDVIV